jgi:FAD/FMN-containing dehydrogenase
VLEFGPPAVNLMQPMPYVAVQQLIDEGNRPGRQNYWTSDFLSELPDEAIDTLVAAASRPRSPFSAVTLVPGGGAVARIPENATAFGQRTAPWNIHYQSVWEDPADAKAIIAQTRDLADAMKPWATGRLYLNYIGDEGLDRVEAAFGPERYARLQELKRVWDPDNVFRHNQNIRP